MAELYQTTPQNITLHLKAIYAEGELDERATCKEYLQVQKEGAGGLEKLTIMDTHEYWQSALTPGLYGIQGR